MARIEQPGELLEQLVAKFAATFGIYEHEQWLVKRHAGGGGRRWPNKEALGRLSRRAAHRVTGENERAARRVAEWRRANTARIETRLVVVVGELIANSGEFLRRTSTRFGRLVKTRVTLHTHTYKRDKRITEFRLLIMTFFSDEELDELVQPCVI